MNEAQGHSNMSVLQKQGDHCPVSLHADIEMPLSTLLLTMPFSSFPRESQRMQKVSPAKVRLTSQPLSPAIPGSTLILPQTSLLSNAPLFSCPEFDKFLEERAKVADRLPTLSSSSAGTSVSPPAASHHRKQAKEDDAMFAL